jgi:hypothetical protein
MLRRVIARRAVAVTFGPGGRLPAVPASLATAQVSPGARDAGSFQTAVLEWYEAHGRALNLQGAARMVVADFGGVFPDDVAALQQLPGVGPYTARAVAAIAFGRRVGAVDTNVRRVVGRATWGTAAVPAPELQVVADELVPHGRAGEWTHALMDIGARFCRPRTPLCDACPARAWCRLATSRAGVADPEPVRRAPRRTSEARPKSSSIAFASTSRWLRGRIIDRARSVHGDGWVTFATPMGEHDLPAVLTAVAGLARDGLLEIDAAGAADAARATRARLPR